METEEGREGGVEEIELKKFSNLKRLSAGSHMFPDLKVSGSHTIAFKVQVYPLRACTFQFPISSTKQNAKLNFTILFITGSFWPTIGPRAQNLPKQLSIHVVPGLRSNALFWEEWASGREESGRGIKKIGNGQRPIARGEWAALSPKNSSDVPEMSFSFAIASRKGSKPGRESSGGIVSRKFLLRQLRIVTIWVTESIGLLVRTPKTTY